MSETFPIPQAMGLLCDLCVAMKAEPVNQYEGCWEVAVDDNWWIALNGHKEAVKCSRGASVPPFTAYVEWNGWPAGFIDPRGGALAAGEAANEDTFCAAVKAAVVKAEGGAA